MAHLSMNNQYAACGQECMIILKCVHIRHSLVSLIPVQFDCVACCVYSSYWTNNMTRANHADGIILLY